VRLPFRDPARRADRGRAAILTAWMDRLQTIPASTPGTRENYVGADRTAAPASRQHSIGATTR
jgi:hypothetical protein